MNLKKDKYKFLANDNEDISDLIVILEELKNGEFSSDEAYFWISKSGNNIGGQIEWSHDTDDGFEIYVLRNVIPDLAKKACTERYGAPLIINSEQDLLYFNIFQGHAIIRESIVRKYLPQYFQDFFKYKKSIEFKDILTEPTGLFEYLSK